MDIKQTFSVLVGKLAIIACRIVKHSGTTLPGKIAARLDRRILSKLSKGFYTILVTGTNGKTTTTSMIAQILSENGAEYITNKSGANLIGGITTLFIEAVNIFGKSKKDHAVIEVDEANVNVILEFLDPDIIVVTNFFRDQLDRYGELYTTLRKVQSGILKSKKAKLILNADDSLCTSLGLGTDKQTLFFGVDDNVSEYPDENITTDAAYCINCKSKYEYSYRVLGHLGGFKCPSCGYQRPSPIVKCTGIDELTTFSTSFRFAVSDASYALTIPAPGFYNIYNALAAITFAHVMNYPISKTAEALKKFEPSFGRMENIRIDDKNIKLILAKNPTGFDQIINYLLTVDERLNVAFLINDRTQDGKDISWLWDVDFEKLTKKEDGLINVYASGTRADDMAVRLKYAGVSAETIKVMKNYDDIIGNGLLSLEPENTLYIVPTYTAMLDIRLKLRNKYNLKDFWI